MLACVTVAFLGATGCASDGRVLAERPGVFRVQEGNYLRIAVWPENELGLSGEYVVEDDGTVHLPLIGAVEVAGLTLGEVRGLLREAYSRTLKEPVVQITPVFPVSVLGAVVRPSLYQVTSSETLFDVISMAGGFAPGAEQDEVRIIRDGEVIELDATETLERGIDLGLRSGDRIFVPRDRWRIGVRDVLLALQSIALIITLTDRLENR